MMLETGIAPDELNRQLQAAEDDDGYPIPTPPEEVLVDSNTPLDELGNRSDAEVRNLAKKTVGPDTATWRQNRERPVAAGKKSGPPDDPYVPFPTETLPPALRVFVEEAALAIDIDPAYVAVPMLAVLAGVIGNARRIQLKRGWCEPCVVWSMTVGLSGEGKSPALDVSLGPVQEKQAEWLRAHSQRLREHEQQERLYEESLGKWKRRGKNNHDPPPEEPIPPAPTRIAVSDSTVEALACVLSENPNGLLLNRDELSGWLNSFDSYRGGKGGDVAHWLAMHGARPMLVDRKTGPRITTVDRAAVSVAGTIQPSALARAIVGDGKGQHLGNGLVARILFAMPPRHARGWSDHEISEAAEAEYKRVVEHLFSLAGAEDDDGNTRPIDLPLTPAAREVFRRFCNRHGQEQIKLGEHLSSAWSKLQGYAARLALVIQLTSSADNWPDGCTEIDADSMRAGIELARWFAEEAARVYRVLGADGDTAEAKLDRDTHRLLEWMEKKGGAVSPRGVQRGIQPYRSMKIEVVEAKLEQLTKTNILTRSVRSATGKGSRDITYYAPATRDSRDGDKAHDSQCPTGSLSPDAVSSVEPSLHNVAYPTDEDWRQT